MIDVRTLSAKQTPPGQPANDRSVTLPADGGGVRLSPVKGKRPRRHRAVARALVVRGAFRVGVAFLSGSFVATSCRPSPPLHFVVLEPPVGRSRRHRSRWSLSSFLLMPDAAADPSTSLRSFLAPLRSRAGSFAAAWWWRVAPLVRLRRLF